MIIMIISSYLVYVEKFTTRTQKNKIAVHQKSSEYDMEISQPQTKRNTHTHTHTQSEIIPKPEKKT